jgi:hypothetical protein
MKCFEGWNKRGLINQIGKVIGVKRGIFEIGSEMKYKCYRSLFYQDNYDPIRDL